MYNNIDVYYILLFRKISRYNSIWKLRNRRSDSQFSSVYFTANPTWTVLWKWDASGRTSGNWTNDRGVRRHGTVFFNLLIHAPRARTCEDHIYIYTYIWWIDQESGKLKSVRMRASCVSPQISRWHSLDTFLLIKSRRDSRTTDHGREYRHII